MDLEAVTFPRSICLRVTRRCNAACSFCQAPNTSRASLSVSQIQVIAKALSAKGVLTIKLSGGEPTVRSDLPEIVNAVALSGIKPVVITNAITIEPSLIEKLSDVGGEFKFSIHRPTNDNDSVLRVRSFEAVLSNIEYVRIGAVRFGINCVITPNTVGLMNQMVRFACQVGARKISFIPVVPRGRAAGSPLFEFDADEIAIVRDNARVLSAEFAARLTVRCIDIRQHDYWIIENDGSLWIERASEDLDLRVCSLSDMLTSGIRMSEDSLKRIGGPL